MSLTMYGSWYSRGRSTDRRHDESVGRRIDRAAYCRYRRIGLLHKPLPLSMEACAQCPSSLFHSPGRELVFGHAPARPCQLDIRPRTMNREDLGERKEIERLCCLGRFDEELVRALYQPHRPVLRPPIASYANSTSHSNPPSISN